MRKLLLVLPLLFGAFRPGNPDPGVITVLTRTADSLIVQGLTSDCGSEQTTGSYAGMICRVQWLSGARVVRTVSLPNGAPVADTLRYHSLVVGAKIRLRLRSCLGTTCSKTITTTFTVPTAGTGTPVIASLTRLSISPKPVTVDTSTTQQFAASATWSDGTTTLPSLSWSSTGGSVNGNGLYTVHDTTGTYRVIVSGGGKADTSVVTIVAPVIIASELYPNRPNNYTTVLGEFDGSATVPSGWIVGGGERSILGTAWRIIYDANADGSASNWARVVDSTAPQSPPYVWQLTMYPGTWDTGHGYGNIFTILPPSTHEMYVSIRFKLDSLYEWHPISNKWLWFDPNVLVQLDEGSRHLPFDNPVLNFFPIPQVNSRPSEGVWHQVEVLLVRGSSGTAKVWLDGVLHVNYTGVNISPENNQWANWLLTGHRGGGGETKTRTSYWWIDHIFIAAP